MDRLFTSKYIHVFIKDRIRGATVRGSPLNLSEPGLLLSARMYSIFAESRPYDISNPIVPRPPIRDSAPPRSRRYTGSIDLLYFPVASI